MQFKLGLKPSLSFKLHLSDYIPDVSKLPPIPDEIDWSVVLGAHHYAGTMFGNNRYGDCFWAAAAKALMTWTGTVGNPASFTDEDVLGAYSAATGFDPKHPSSDQGTEPTIGFRYLQQTGIKGLKFGPPISVSVTRPDLIMAAHHLGGGLMVGMEFFDEWERTQIWGTGNALTYAGGHEIWSPKASRRDGLYIETWGEETYRLIPWASLAKYCMQLTVNLSPTFFNAVGQAGNAIKLADLQNDLGLIS